ncbi:hypothetical protein JXM83_07460 [Candidatus Woesearchaeota archaeon]|nr:hypothetical protein [Candidatus Woesearchaeota archaeon]
MAKIIHKTPNYEFIENGGEDILITNLKGSFAYLPLNENLSKYHGIFYYDNDTKDMIKVINNFKKQHSEITVENLRANRNNEQIFFFNNTIIYKSIGEVILNLDTRFIYDFNNWNRIYEFEEINKDTMLIKYSRDDFKFHIALNSNNLAIEKIGNWVREYYSKDEERNSPPYEFYTFDALKLNLTDDLVLGFGKTRENAIQELENTLENKESLIKAKMNFLQTIKNPIKDSRISHALNLATRSLNSLIIEQENFSGIFAGLPWFFQFWTRDEAISTGALIATKRYSLTKKILIREISNILNDGRNPNRFPESKLGSADGIGLSFLRLFQLIKTLEKNKELFKYFTNEELEQIYKKLQDSITKQKTNLLKNNLIYNGPKETWMDTDETITGERDTREGFCIEIQALFLSMLEFRENLEKILQKQIGTESSDFKKEIRKRFTINGVIADRIKTDNTPDETPRPNIFLAYNYNKTMFTKKTWENTMDTILPKLWLNWGGLSSISKDSKKYCNTYTGQNNFSYHRGDSWFFINNFAAIAMYNLNKKKYFDKVKQIIEASSKDIISNGTVGHASELSDANVLTSRASPIQSWSASTFIELGFTVLLDL